MDFNSCRDEVMSFIDEASKDFGSQYALNKEKFGKLDAVCDGVDKLIEDFDCEYFDVSADDITKQFTIAVVCDEMILEHGRSHEFFKLIQMLTSFSFTKKGRSSVCVTLNIDNMWERVCG